MIRTNAGTGSPRALSNGLMKGGIKMNKVEIFSDHQPMDTLVLIALYRHPSGYYKLSVIDAFDDFMDEFETPKERQAAIQKFTKEATWVSPIEDNQDDR